MRRRGERELEDRSLAERGRKRERGRGPRDEWGGLGGGRVAGELSLQLCVAR